MKGQVRSMNDVFKAAEKLFRAVYPPEVAEMFWRRDGSLSSAAFADPKGLSVDRSGGRTDDEAVSMMRQRFEGRIISVYVKNCVDIGAVVKYLPSRTNQYHSEIHGSMDIPLLSKSQRRYLASRARVVGE